MKKNVLIGFLIIGLSMIAVIVLGQDSTSVNTLEGIQVAFKNLNWWKIISFIIGIIGIGATTIIGLIWSVIKEGRETYNAYLNGIKDSWTPKEKDKYIKESGEFIKAIMNLKKVIKMKLTGKLKK